MQEGSLVTGRHSPATGKTSYDKEPDGSKGRIKL